MALGLPLAALAQHAPGFIKFSHVVTPDAPKGKGAERFKQLAEQRSKGRVKVEVDANSQLYKDQEEPEALQLGSVQMLVPSLAKFGPLGVKGFEAFDLPFIFKDTAAFRAVTEGPVGQGKLAKLEPKGITGLADWDKGLDLYTQKAYEVQKHFTVSNHGHIAYAVEVSKRFRDALPADIRAILEGARRDATTYANAIAETENLQALEKIKASGRSTVSALSPAETEAWKQAMFGVHKEMSERVGADTILAVCTAAGFVPPK